MRLGIFHFAYYFSFKFLVHTTLAHSMRTDLNWSICILGPSIQKGTTCLTCASCLTWVMRLVIFHFGILFFVQVSGSHNPSAFNAHGPYLVYLHIGTKHSKGHHLPHLRILPHLGYEARNFPFLHTIFRSSLWLTQPLRIQCARTLFGLFAHWDQAFKRAPLAS